MNVMQGSVFIAGGQPFSTAGYLADRALTHLFIPAAWTTADLTVQLTLDGVTFFDLDDDAAAEVTIKATAGRAVECDLTQWIGRSFFRLRSGTRAIAVNQAADRVITFTAVK